MQVSYRKERSSEPNELLRTDRTGVGRDRPMDDVRRPARTMESRTMLQTVDWDTKKPLAIQTAKEASCENAL